MDNMIQQGFPTIPAIASGLMGILIGHTLERKDIGKLQVNSIWQLFIIACTFSHARFGHLANDLPMNNEIAGYTLRVIYFRYSCICFATPFLVSRFSKYPKGIKLLLLLHQCLTAYCGRYFWSV